MSNIASLGNPKTRLVRDDPAGAKVAIGTAIEAAAYASVGALFNPLLIAFAKPGDFTSAWTSRRGDHYIDFLQFNGSRRDGFLPLGDYAMTTQGSLARTAIMLVKSPRPGVLAHPAGFTRIADDSGSGNPTHIAYYWPIAPVGFHAMGICIGIDGKAPNPANYWCVASEHVVPSGSAPYWSDSGQQWTVHNGSLNTPVVDGIRPQDRMVLAPTTLLSNQYGVRPDRACCLVLDKLFLPLKGGGVPYPDYQLSYGQGTSTPQGIEVVAVLPCSVVLDPLTGNDAQDSPFYYVASQPYWTCAHAIPAPMGGTYSSAFMTGTSAIESRGFRHTTSLTVGADVGVEAGEEGGLAARLAVSFTSEMQLAGTVRTGGGQPQLMQTLSLKVPRATRMLIWQKNVDLVIYRTSGQPVAAARFMTSEIDFTDSNPPDQASTVSRPSSPA